jgi:hypothetical protein
MEKVKAGGPESRSVTETHKIMGVPKIECFGNYWPSLRVVDPVEDPEALEGSLPAVSLSNPSKGSTLRALCCSLHGTWGLVFVRVREKKCLRFEPYLSLMLQFCKKYVQC